MIAILALFTFFLTCQTKNSTEVDCVFTVIEWRNWKIDQWHNRFIKPCAVHKTDEFPGSPNLETQ